MRFVVFNSAGLPVSTGGCPEGQVEAQAGEGETALPWTGGNPLEWRLVDGVLHHTAPIA